MLLGNALVLWNGVSR
ncbi:Protein of unknown function [Bacillus cereus]|nr:Protein of unknown function [Bacillus cereus]SCN31115.1 Protein of unknown function [Bacillus wiedmannii]SCN31272.1 Protein of unknown function [Bacillus cereus]